MTIKELKGWADYRGTGGWYEGPEGRWYTNNVVMVYSMKEEEGRKAVYSGNYPFIESVKKVIKGEATSYVSNDSLSLLLKAIKVKKKAMTNKYPSSVVLFDGRSVSAVGFDSGGWWDVIDSVYTALIGIEVPTVALNGYYLKKLMPLDGVSLREDNNVQWETMVDKEVFSVICTALQGKKTAAMIEEVKRWKE